MFASRQRSPISIYTTFNENNVRELSTYKVSTCGRVKLSDNLWARERVLCFVWKREHENARTREHENARTRERENVWTCGCERLNVWTSERL